MTSPPPLPTLSPSFFFSAAKTKARGLRFIPTLQALPLSDSKKHSHQRVQLELAVVSTSFTEFSLQLWNSLSSPLLEYDKPWNTRPSALLEQQQLPRLRFGFPFSVTCIDPISPAVCRCSSLRQLPLLRQVLPAHSPAPFPWITPPVRWAGALNSNPSRDQSINPRQWPELTCRCWHDGAVVSSGPESIISFMPVSVCRQNVGVPARRASTRHAVYLR